MPSSKERPYCFGELENVFPLGEEGLRASPERCFPCVHKTECLRTAMQGAEGIKVKQEFVDRAYGSKTIGFFDRWSRKKALHRQDRALRNRRGALAQNKE
jgi:hypothetical protein